MNTLKILSRKQKEIIGILYNNEGITQKELSDLLGSSPSATSNIIQKILLYNPPLIAKEPVGKYRCYALTDYGKKCYEALINGKTVVDDSENVVDNSGNVVIALQNSKTIEFNDDLKRILIANILNGVNNDSNDILLLGLRNLSIDIIMATFSMAEFLFLCFLLGIISKTMSAMDAANLLLPESEIDVKIMFAKATYGKLKDLIASELLSKREEELFGSLDSDEQGLHV